MRVVESSHPTTWWTRLEDGRSGCDVCPRACALHEGQRGSASSAGASGDAIVLTTYGRSSGLLRRSDREEAAEPLPAGNPGPVVRDRRLQPGVPLLPELGHLQVPRRSTRSPTAHRRRRSPTPPCALGCRSVAFTYNDPVIFLEYAVDVADACRERGVRTVAVTAGYVNPAPGRELFAHLDAANVDLKGFTEGFYHRVCAGHLDPVLGRSSIWYTRPTSGSSSPRC